eukprot:scaffold7770_cov94-Cylindrotheca_fusiformis.AAC.1
MATTTTTRTIHMDSIRDNLEAMIVREEKFYHCEEYLKADGPAEEEEEPHHYSPLHVVEEMANLVTDVQYLSAWNDDNKEEEDDEFKSKSPRSSMVLNVDNSSRRSIMHSNNIQTKTSKRRQEEERELLSAWRQQMCSWTRSVVRGLRLDHDATEVAFSILDRYLTIQLKQEHVAMDRERFQLYCMVSLYIASKSGASLRRIRLSSVARISQGMFDEAQIMQTEREILNAVQWHVNPPTMTSFCELYMDLYSTKLPRRVHSSCEYLTELALADEFFVSVPASVTALGIVLLATQQAGIPFSKTQEILMNLQGLVRVQGETFDTVFERLECLC